MKLVAALSATFLAAFLVAFSALAVEPDEILDDPKLEQRAREVSKELRCVVCQNQSIDESNADLARDMRILVRKRLQAGDSNAEVIDYMVSRYGDFVLLEPPFKASTYALWFGPAVIALLGILAIVAFYRRRAAEGPPPAAQPLSEEEERRLARLLEHEAARDGKDDDA